MLASGCDYVLGLQQRPDAALGEAAVDGLEPDAAPTLCLSDSFDLQIDPAKWRPITNSAPAIFFRIAAEQLAIEYATGGTTSDERMISQNVFDFTGGEITAELSQGPGPSTKTSLGLELPNGTLAYRIDVSNVAISCLDATGQVCTQGYDPDVHRHLRIRHLPMTNQIAYEYRSAAGTFMPLHVVSVQTPIDQLVFTFVGSIVTEETPPLSMDEVVTWDTFEFRTTHCPL